MGGTLADALKTLSNAERRGRRQVLLRPVSKVVVRYLQLMQKHGYIADFTLVDDHRGNKIVVNLNGRLNKVGVISPRYNVPLESIESWVNNILPSRQFGFLVITTSDGPYHGPRGGPSQAHWWKASWLLL